MENYEKADQFLADCKKGKSSFVVIYEVRQDGGINRMKFTYDGIDMYVISTSGIWMKNDIPGDCLHVIYPNQRMGIHRKWVVLL